ncbi:MAG TPA: prepilin-type N-terminal cleavage/methylation domain-containing protein [Tepidisphaeraceae bacterium]|jgi:prepilin-type N-terminal cleavage/methylation domain-containing protein|nr:prepilin-type N-terminal cleavage/methylation domain-containing protein [Tepidisphaeraceae bacterium]
MRRRGFTLTELLVVISLIVILIALALPAFNFITGNRSVDAGQNIVGALLGRARSEAINQQRTMGVAFYFDRDNERTAMAIVSGDATSGESDYHQWTTTAAAGQTVSYAAGQMVYYAGWDTGNAGGAMGNDADEASVGNAPDSATGAARPVDRKFVTRRYIARVDIPSSTTGNAPPNPPAVQNTFWEEAPPLTLELFDADIEYLQPGIGLQLVNDPQGVVTNNDRFLRTGIVLFNTNGQLSTDSYAIQAGTPLGDLIGLSTGQRIPRNPDPVFPGVQSPRLQGHTAVMMYEREPFLNAPGTEEDTRYPIGPYAATPAADELTEENWLSDNGLLLLVNRYNGTLTRSE